MENKYGSQIIRSSYTYNTIDHNDMLFIKDFSLGRWPSNKSRPQKNLSSPNTLPREENAIITNNDTVEESNIAQPSFGGGPPKLVFTFLFQSK